MFDFLGGKKTYLVAAVGAGVVIAQAFGVVIPDYVFQLLGITGLVTVRSAIANGR